MPGILKKCLSVCLLMTAMTALLKVTPCQASEDISLKARTGSLGNIEENELKKAYDAAENITADADAVSEAQRKGLTYKKNGFSNKDLKYMSAVIYSEATGMTYEAKIAVGNVVLNRMRDTDPNGFGHVMTIKDVIYDNKWGTQFAVSAGKPSPMDRAIAIYKSMDPGEYGDWRVEEMKIAIKAAKDVLTGYKTIPDDFLYFNGYVAKTTEKCRDKGWEFSIMGMVDKDDDYQHIYFGID